MFLIGTLHLIMYGSNQGEWDASEVLYVWERWEKHTEFLYENVQEKHHSQDVGIDG
jgi:hypothetical protein